MAKNFVQEGRVVTVTAPYTLTSGQGCLVGSLFGVALADIANGADGDVATEGVFDVTKLSTDVVTQGALLYWDQGNRRLTITASTHKLVGLATRADGNGVLTARILIRGGSN